MLQKNYEWADIDLTATGIDNALVLFMVFEPNSPPRAIGSGFIIKAEGKSAQGITAAHVLSEIKALQQPNTRTHRTTLTEFLPKSPLLDLDRTKVRAFCMCGERIEAAIINSVVFDEKNDVGAFYLSLEENSVPFFETKFLISDSIPAIDSLVCAVGMANIDIKVEDDNNFQLSKDLCARIGRVTAYYPEGHLLCRGPCMETTISVYGGMSGGPVFLFGENIGMMPFGIICQDTQRTKAENLDNNTRGNMLIAILPTTVQILSNDVRRVFFKFSSGSHFSGGVEIHSTDNLQKKEEV